MSFQSKRADWFGDLGVVMFLPSSFVLSDFFEAKGVTQFRSRHQSVVLSWV